MTISSIEVGHKHIKMYWYTNDPNVKVKVIFNNSTREWACGNLIGKKPLDLARKALRKTLGGSVVVIEDERTAKR